MSRTGGRTEELESLYVEACQTPFPYSGLRKLLAESGGAYEGLIPDFDLYLSTIVGYCSWGRSILKWDQQKIDGALKNLEKDFFETHTEYQPLQTKITEQDLASTLLLVEAMRKKLIGVLEATR